MKKTYLILGIILLLIGGYFTFINYCTINKGSIAPVIAESLISGKEKKFDSLCQVPFWWKITNTAPYLITETVETLLGNYE